MYFLHSNTSCFNNIQVYKIKTIELSDHSLFQPFTYARRLAETNSCGRHRFARGPSPANSKTWGAEVSGPRCNFHLFNRFGGPKSCFGCMLWWCVKSLAGPGVYGRPALDLSLCPTTIVSPGPRTPPNPPAPRETWVSYVPGPRPPGPVYLPRDWLGSNRRLSVRPSVRTLPVTLTERCNLFWRSVCSRQFDRLPPPTPR